RSWSPAEKVAIVAESYDASETVCSVARRYGLTPQQLFTWRRLARRSAMDPSPAMFVPVVVEATGPQPPPAAKAPRRLRRRPRAAGIELQIAGAKVPLG